MTVRTAETLFLGDAGSIIRAAQEAATATESATGKIAASNTKLAASAEAAATKTAAAHDKMIASAGKVNASFAKLGSFAAVGAVAAMADMAIKVEKAATAIAIAGGTSSEAGQKIEAAFKTTSGTAESSAAKIGQAFSTIAGELKVVEGHSLGASEAMKVMRAAMDLTDATGGDLTATTEALGKVLLTFHLGASKAAEAANILFNASKVTGISVGDFTTLVDKARGRLGALAPSLGETAGLMAELAKQGVSGRLTMGALGGAFGTLLSQSKPVNKVLEELHVHVFNSKGGFVGLKSVIEQLHPALGKYTEASQLAATKVLFGEKANKQLLEVIHQGPAAFDAATRAVTRQGAAAEAAAKQHKTLEGEANIAKAALANLASDIGNHLIPALKKVAEALSDGIKWLEKHKEAAKALEVVITTILGAALVDFAVIKVAKFVGGIKTMISAGAALGNALLFKLVPAFATAEGEIVAGTAATAGTMTGLLMTTGIGAAVVLLGAAAFELGKHWKEVTQGLEEATQGVANFMVDRLDEIIKSINEFTNKISFGLIPAIGELHHLSGAGEGEGSSGMGGLGTYGNLEKLGGPLGTGTGQGSANTRSVQSLLNLGLSPVAAQGVVKAMQGETNRNLEKGAHEEGREGAYGIAQWLGPRRAGLESFAKSRHKPASNLEIQLEYLAQELRGPEAHTLNALKHARSVNEAAGIFIKGFERPENAAGVEQRAAGYGTETLPGATTKAKKVAAEAYSNPFAGASGVSRSRTDQGVDFSFSGSLGAVGKGRIVNIVQDPGGFGTEVIEELTEGPHKGQFVYYGLETGAVLGISKGANVSSGQKIATGKGSGGIELGFASSAAGVPVTPYGSGQSHGQPTAGGNAFSSFLASIGKGGSNLQLATAQFSEVAKKAAAAIAHLILSPAQESKVKGLEAGALGAHAQAAMYGGYATEASEAWEHARVKQEKHRQPLSTSAGAGEQGLIDTQDIQTAKARKLYYEREVRALGKEAKAWAKLRDQYLSFARHAKGNAKKQALEKAAGYEGKVKAAQAEAKALGGTIAEVGEQITEAQNVLSVTLPGEIAAAHAEQQSGDLSAYQGALGKIDLEQRAELLTPEQAKAAKKALAEKALGGGFGELSGEGLLQVKGDLVEFGKALESATSATEAHTQATLDATKALLEKTQAEQRLAEVENGSLLKSMADLISGQIGGVDYHGRQATPGSGSAARY
jgi:TP901 family phage tail tape measure protein